MEMTAFIEQELGKTAEIVAAIRNDGSLIGTVKECAERIAAAMRSGNKVLLAGNGGSAADAQHMAGEFVSRFHYDRPGLPAIALTVDTSILTAVGNDYGYEKVFQRQVDTLGVKGDVFWAYSTSGRSANILAAMESARKAGLVVVGFCGAKGWARPELCDITIAIPSTETPKIQEGHLILGHIICGMVESTMFPRS